MEDAKQKRLTLIASRVRLRQAQEAMQYSYLKDDKRPDCVDHMSKPITERLESADDESD